jgi:hypothetical protein
MNMRHRNLLKSFEEGESGKRENNGGEEPNWSTTYVYKEMS